MPTRAAHESSYGHSLEHCGSNLINSDASSISGAEQAVRNPSGPMRTAEEIGVATLARLGAQAARNREAGNALRAEIRTIMQAHTTGRLTAKRIQALLPRERQPSIRRIQEHMQAITKETSSVSPRKGLLLHKNAESSASR